MFEGESGVALPTLVVSLPPPSRFLCTGLVSWVFIRHNHTPLVKASGRELCYILLSGVFMSYAMTFLFLAKPSPAICAMRRLGLGTSFAVCYSALLTKTNRIARIFSGVKDGAGAARPRFISPSSQVSGGWPDGGGGGGDDGRHSPDVFFRPAGVHLSESHLRPAGDGVSLAAAGGARHAALHVAGATADRHPQV